MSTCSSCGAPMEWALSRNTGKRVPLNVGEAPNANLRVLGETEAGVPIVAYCTPGEGTRVSHFATCPDARKHRRAR